MPLSERSSDSFSKPDEEKMTMKCCGFVLATICILVASTTKAQTGKRGPMAKLPSNLAILHEQYAAHLAQRSAVVFSSADPLVRVVDGRAVIDAIASGDVEALKSDLVSLGMKEAVAFGRVVSGQLPITAIPKAAGLASLQFAQTAAATTHAGRITSQGDRAMRADLVRATFGLTGNGVTVGALSDSFNCLGGAAADISSGDLPSVTVIEEISICANAIDEGRAMLQIVHDVAPGASLAFASAFNGQAAFASNILALAAAGAKVIVDDVLYFAEPMFQDGIIAQSVDNVVAGGVAYFSSAGNQARQSYQSAFRAGDSFADGAFPSIFGAPAFSGGVAHNFDSSGGKNHFQSITIPAFTTVIFSFQWDSPFFSVSGSPGTQNDLDIYLLDASASQVLAGSAFNNIGSDAVELLGMRNNGTAPVTLKLMIVKHSGANPGLIKYVYFGPATISDFNTQSGTIFGHANAAGAEAVGAAPYFQTPAFGISPPQLEPFSSSGATPILFDLAGNRLATPDPRASKPEIVAPDGADTTFFGFDFDGNGFPNFFGTSASAPHAAAVAALLLHTKPTLTPVATYRILENTAIDMGPQGFDNDSGFGLIWADAAVQAVFPADIGVYRNGFWALDLNGNRQWDGCAVDGCFGFGGVPGDVPVVGDWTGDGITKIGIFRDGGWALDLNGNDQWDGCGIDGCFGFGGVPGDMPVVGDWTGDGITKIGVFRDGNWGLDLNGNRQWDGCAIDGCVVEFGLPGDTPVVGDWTGDGITKIGVFRDGGWALDLNGNRQWDGCEADACIGFGLPGDVPLAGKW